MSRSADYWTAEPPITGLVFDILFTTLPHPSHLDWNWWAEAARQAGWADRSPSFSHPKFTAAKETLLFVTGIQFWAEKVMWRFCVLRLKWTRWLPSLASLGHRIQGLAMMLLQNLDLEKKVSFDGQLSLPTQNPGRRWPINLRITFTTFRESLMMQSCKGPFLETSSNMTALCFQVRIEVKVRCSNVIKHIFLEISL